MKLADFDAIFYLNKALEQRPRFMIESWLNDFQVEATRIPVIDAFRLSKRRRFISNEAYAHLLAFRMALRRALRDGAESILILSDAALPVPDLEQRLAALKLPSDWEILLLEAQHREKPEWIAEGLVKARNAIGNLGVAIRSSSFRKLQSLLVSRRDRDDQFLFDRAIAKISAEAGGYAAFPDLLVPQEQRPSSVEGLIVRIGSPATGYDSLSGIAAENWGIPPWEFTDSDSEHSRNGFAWEDIGMPVSPLTQVAFVFPRGVDPSLVPLWQRYGSTSASRPDLFTDFEINLEITYAAAAAVALDNILSKTSAQHLVILPPDTAPLRPFEELQQLLQFDGRTRFQWEAFADSVSPPTVAELPATTFPSTCLLRHSRSMVLQRGLAEKIARDKHIFPRFRKAGISIETVPWLGGAEWEIGTYLAIMGYPVADRVASQSLTLPPGPKPMDLGLALGSGAFFTSKENISYHSTPLQAARRVTSSSHP